MFNGIQGLLSLYPTILSFFFYDVFPLGPRKKENMSMIGSYFLKIVLEKCF